MKKKFVLDTNVVLHDSSCAFNFQDNDVIIPITVIEELDSFKRGHDQIHFNAREFIRFLDQFRGDKIIDGGESLGEGRGKILILTNYGDDTDVKKAFFENKPDHRILSAALYLQKQNKREKVIVVSKDVNLRLKAKSLGLEADDYYTDKIEDIEKLYRGIRLLENFEPELIDRLYSDNEIPVGEADVPSPTPNEYFILRNGNKSALAFYNPTTKMLQHVEKGLAYGIKPRNAEQTFALHALMNTDAPLVTLSGKAGTG
jgi:PhoH-like ATPase